ncbi:hypothetical protein MTO96_020358 [Rhipicephalus appendiculatus]
MMNGPMDWTDAVLSQPRLQTRRGGSVRSARRYTHRRRFGTAAAGNPWQAWLRARRRGTAGAPQPSGEWRRRPEGGNEEGDAPFFPCSSSSCLHVCRLALSASLFEGTEGCTVGACIPARQIRPTSVGRRWKTGLGDSRQQRTRRLLQNRRRRKRAPCVLSRFLLRYVYPPLQLSQQRLLLSPSF